MTATWQPNPEYPQMDGLVDDQTGLILATVEQFYDDGPTYPTAFDPRTSRWERGGPMRDAVEARLWAERVAGLHPLKERDARPPFYG